MKASAVCRFSLSEVQEAFQGPYMENQDSGSKWKEYTGKIPDPRPGTVNTHAQRHPLGLLNTRLRPGEKSLSPSASEDPNKENANREQMKVIKSKDYEEKMWEDDRMDEAQNATNQLMSLKTISMPIKWLSAAVRVMASLAGADTDLSSQHFVGLNSNIAIKCNGQGL